MYNATCSSTSRDPIVSDLVLRDEAHRTEQEDRLPGGVPELVGGKIERADRARAGCLRDLADRVGRGPAVRAGGRQHLRLLTGGDHDRAGAFGEPEQGLDGGAPAPPSRRHRRPPARTIATVRSAGSRGRASLATSSPSTVTAKSSGPSSVPDCETGGAATTRYAPSGCSRSPPMLHDLGERALCPPTGAAPATRATTSAHGREHSWRGRCRPPPGRRVRRPPVEPRHVAPPQGAVPVMVSTSIVAESSRSVLHRPGVRLPARRA